MSQSYSSSTDKQRYGSSESILDKASDAAQSAAEQGREVAAKAQQASEDAYYATERAIRQNPMLTVALSMALGFALGALWKIGGHRQNWFDRMSNNYYEPAMRSWRHAASRWW